MILRYTNFKNKYIMISKNNFSYKAYEFIKEKIIKLELYPGSPINEKELQSILKIGRTPIREAILKLAHENLIDIIPRKGIYVKQITFKGVKDLLETLLILERSAAQIASMEITINQLDEIKEINNKINDAIVKKDSLSITYFNSIFHNKIAEASHNDYLIDFIRKIRVEEQRIAYLSFTKDFSITYPLEEHFKIVSKHHNDIITSLEKRETQKIDKLIMDHSRLFYNRIFKYLESNLSENYYQKQFKTKRYF